VELINADIEFLRVMGILETFCVRFNVEAGRVLAVGERQFDNLSESRKTRKVMNNHA